MTSCSDYAPTSIPAAPERPGGRISHIVSDSPAARAGLCAGMTVTAVDGEPLHDIIDWLWLSAEESIELATTHGTYQIERFCGEPWGIDFADPLFDGVRLCHNNCTFCFMAMLPPNMRPALSVRDDDYRLSFLQGNFVTLTNLTASDVERITRYHLSPLHVSLHAVTPQVREHLMGKNHARGLEVLDELLAANITVHAQVVLIPTVNDGPELDATLAWIEQRPHIQSVGIVPYGYTRHAAIQSSYNDPAAAQALIAQLAPWQQRARAATGTTRFQLSDEFYCNAHPAAIAAHLPPAAHYDGYPQFEDGIGLLRAFLDDWNHHIKDPTLVDKPAPAILATARQGDRPPAADHSACRSAATLVTGTVFARFLAPLIESSPLASHLTICPVENRFFGGNVDVAGLLTAQDVIAQVRGSGGQNTPVLLPAVMFNADGLTLDGHTALDIEGQLGRKVIVSAATVEGLLEAICNPNF